jgi:8-oxo-dGTP pyrophosphatase MutT (NUDIX family)
VEAEAASRELSEETGYSGELRPVARLVTNGYSTEVRHVFVCTDARLTGDPHPDAGEHLEVVLVDMVALRGLLRAGEMTVTDAAYVALDAEGLLG